MAFIHQGCLREKDYKLILCSFVGSSSGEMQLITFEGSKAPALLYLLPPGQNLELKITSSI